MMKSCKTMSKCQGQSRSSVISTVTMMESNSLFSKYPTLWGLGSRLFLVGGEGFGGCGIQGSNCFFSCKKSKCYFDLKLFSKHFIHAFWMVSDSIKISLINILPRVHLTGGFEDCLLAININESSGLRQRLKTWVTSQQSDWVNIIRKCPDHVKRINGLRQFVWRGLLSEGSPWQWWRSACNTIITTVSRAEVWALLLSYLSAKLDSINCLLVHCFRLKYSYF